MIEFKSISGADFLLLEPVDKIDFILQYLDKELSKPQTPDEICEVLFKVGKDAKEAALIPKQVKMICEKLENEGYLLVSRQTIENIDIGYFMISFEGNFLLTNQGYREHQKRENDENTRLDKLAAYQTKLSEGLTYATWILAVGTLLLVLIEFLKWYYGQ